MRIFVGIKLSEEIGRYITNWQEQNREHPIRFIEKNNLHVTLIPPWYEKTIESVDRKLQHAILHHRPIDLVFEKMRLFPRAKPRLIWIEGNTPQALRRLQQSLLTTLEKKPEKRPLLLHVTIGRLPKDSFPVLQQIHIQGELSLTMKVTNLTLFRSYLSSQGSRYESLGTYSLMSEEAS